MKKIHLALLFLLLSMLACNLPAHVNTGPQPIQWATQPANPTTTPTAFVPAQPSPTPPLSIETAIPSITPTPTTPSQADRIVNLLILGSDQRQSADFRTDVILFISINLDQGNAGMVSFPRDLYVTLPGWGENRINTAMEFGGFSLMADTFEYNFGVRPSFYILTNFQGFVSIVDSLGGIDIQAAQTLTDQCHLPQAIGGYCTILAGPVHLDGQTALWYVRSRYSTSDFDRGRRAQEVLLGLFRSLMSINAIQRAPELYQAYRSSVDTNLSLEQILPLLQVASQIYNEPARLRRYTITPAEAYPYTLPDSGASVLIPNYEAIQGLLWQTMHGSP